MGSGFDSPGPYGRGIEVFGLIGLVMGITSAVLILNESYWGAMATFIAAFVCGLVQALKDPKQ